MFDHLKTYFALKNNIFSSGHLHCLFNLWNTVYGDKNTIPPLYEYTVGYCIPVFPQSGKELF